MTNEEKQLATIAHAITTQDYQVEIESLREFVKKGMHEGYDYGLHPGTKTKTLKKPGAEKLLKKFGLVPEFILEKEITDVEKRYCYYKYRCKLIHYASGKFAGEAVRSSNNREPFFSKQDIFTALSNVEAKAQKRALVAATHTATMAGEIFYDAEDDSSTPPKSGATKDNDPERLRLIGKMFATAKERGINTDDTKKMIYEKYNVDSAKEVTNKQIAEFTDWLMSDYRAKITEPVLPKETSKVEASESPEKEIKEDTVILCYTCQKNPIDPKLKYYCSETCKENYYKKKKTSFSFQNR